MGLRLKQLSNRAKRKRRSRLKRILALVVFIGAVLGGVVYSYRLPEWDTYKSAGRAPNFDKLGQLELVDQLPYRRKIDVDRGKEPRFPDSNLRFRISGLFTRNEALSDVEVRVEDGVVVLTGRVDRLGLREELELKIRNIEGVVDVINRLEVVDYPPEIARSRAE